MNKKMLLVLGGIGVIVVGYMIWKNRKPKGDTSSFLNVVGGGSQTCPPNLSDSVCRQRCEGAGGTYNGRQCSQPVYGGVGRARRRANNQSM